MMVAMRTRWWGWGDPSKSFPLEERPRLWPALVAHIGEPSGGSSPVDMGAIRLPPPSLSDETLVRLAAASGGAEALTTEAEPRIRHAYGKSYRDLVRIRRGEIPNPPAAVLFPGDHAAVAAVLEVAREFEVPVVPFGGGTSVVGGVEGPPGPYVVLSLARLDRVLAVDFRSRTARVQGGIFGPDLERQLADHGVTLGHFPQSFEFSTLGGWIAARSAGQQSTLYGKIEDMVVSLRVATPAGDLETRPLPAASDGPDLNRFLSGSEGTMGVITEASVRVRPVPSHRHYSGILMPSFAAGANAIRELVQAGLEPATVRLSDAAETEGTFALRKASRPGMGSLMSEVAKRIIGPLDGRCLMILGFEGTAGDVADGRYAARSILRKAGGVDLGAAVGREWYAHRFDLPYLRDVLLDQGVMVDTLETSTVWSGLDALYSAVRRAIEQAMGDWGTPAWVFCHVSHAYEVGASLYFTMIARQDPHSPLDQWLAAKRAATAAIMANGGSLSHHHGVGRDHAPWYAQEVGPLGLALVRSARQAADPGGLMNPGVFFSS